MASTTNPVSTADSGPAKKVWVPRRQADPLRRPAARSRPPAGAGPSGARPSGATGPPLARPSVPPAPSIPAGPPKEPTSEMKPTDMPEGWSKFPLKTTKRALLADLRFHVMRLHSKSNIDPNEEKEFTRPVRLQRRDPRAPPSGAKEAQNASESAEPEVKLDPEEQAKLEAAEAEKEAEKAATLAAIAPYGGAQRQKKNAFKKKTQQHFTPDEAANKLKYEEANPWHIEDFDNKNIWVGMLEGALSDGSYAVFMLEDNDFKMIPIKRWYKFVQSSQFDTLSIEEAETVMKKKTSTPRWLMQITKQEEKELARREEQENRAAMKQMVTVRGDRLKNKPKAEVADADELDFDENFQDDEETPMVEGDEEENKEIEKRLRKEHLSANFFNNRGEKEWDEEEKETRKRARMEKIGGKKVKKYLRNIEKNQTYESDSDENPYYTGSDSDSSEEEEARREEERKKAEEEKKKAAEKVKADMDVQKKKEETPAADNKKDAPMEKLKSPSKKATAADAKMKASLKRSGGDANLSERESGTETPSGRKKIRNQSTAPGPTSSAKGLLKRTRDTTAGAAGSDNEAADASGTETPGNATKKQKIKLKMGTDPKTAASAAGSPAGLAPPAGPASPAASPGTGNNASRAGSPTPVPASNISITADEVRAVLNLKPEGQLIAEFLSHFKGRVDKGSYQQLLALLKPLSRQKGKLICPK